MSLFFPVVKSQIHEFVAFVLEPTLAGIHGSRNNVFCKNMFIMEVSGRPNIDFNY
jgi:hypothetical protein